MPMVRKADEMMFWETIEKADEWLDHDVGKAYQNAPLAQDWARVGKIIEELGEAINALILWTGQNPRKGYKLSAELDMLDELADTAITAILAIQHYTKDVSETKAILDKGIAKLESRIPWHHRGITKLESRTP
jgi:hypothetical protein